jgi:hypothetical protein
VCTTPLTTTTTRPHTTIMPLVDLIRSGTPLLELKAHHEAREWVQRCYINPPDISPRKQETSRGILGCDKYLIPCQGCGVTMIASPKRHFCFSCIKTKKKLTSAQRIFVRCKECGVQTGFQATKKKTICRNCCAELSTPHR